MIKKVSIIITILLFTIISGLIWFESGKEERDNKRGLDLHEIDDAVQAYYNVHRQYPKQLEDLEDEFIEKVPTNFLYGNYQYKLNEFESGYSLYAEHEGPGIEHFILNKTYNNGPLQ